MENNIAERDQHGTWGVKALKSRTIKNAAANYIKEVCYFNSMVALDMEVTQHKTRWLKVNNEISIWTSSKIYIFVSALRILNGFQVVLCILMRCEISPFCFMLRGLMVTQKERHGMVPALPVSLGSRKTALIRPESSCIIHAPRKHPFKPAATIMTGMRLLDVGRYQTYNTGTGPPVVFQRHEITNAH